MGHHRASISVVLALVASAAVADQGPPVTTDTGTKVVAGAACAGTRVRIDGSNGRRWCCVSSVWADCSSTDQVTATGTATTKSAGDWAKSGPLDASATSVTATGGSTKTLGAWMVPLDATGTPSAATYLRGDRTWAAPTGGNYPGLMATYGCANDGVTDDTTKIQNALNANAGKIVFAEPGVGYLVSNVINVPAGTMLLGGGADLGNGDGGAAVGTRFIRAGAIMSVFVMQVRSSLSRLSVEHTGGIAVTSGKAISIVDSYVTLNHVGTLNAWDAIYIGSAVQVAAVMMSNIELRYNYHSAVTIDGSLALANDAYISKIFTVADRGTYATTADHFVFIGNVQAIHVEDANTDRGRYGLWAVQSGGLYPQFCRFTDVQFDGSVTSLASGVTLDNAARFVFTNCWFSAGGNAPFVRANGAVLNNTDDISFVNCQFINSGGSGIVVQSTARRTKIIGSSVVGNNLFGAGDHGIVIAGGTTDFIVQGNVLTNTGGLGGLQGYGVVVNNGASDRYIIADNLVSGNAISGVSDGGTGVNKRVANNY